MDMNFRTWIETEAGLNSGFPSMQINNRGSSTPASDEVRRTGLQPQVDSHEIHTSEKDEQDKIQAIDGALKRADSEIPQGKEYGKLGKFKKLWDLLKSKWEDLKIEKPPEGLKTSGLGSAKGDEEMMQFMQQNPNSNMSGIESVPSPQPGMF